LSAQSIAVESPPHVAGGEQRHEAQEAHEASFAASSRMGLLDAARRAPWKWAAYNFGAWALMALLFAGQEAVRSPRPFGHLYASYYASYIPCALFTPLIAFVTLRFRFSDSPARAAIAHASVLFLFLTLGSVLMGFFEWIEPWAMPNRTLTMAIDNALGRYVAIDTLIYFTIATTIAALGYGRESRERAVRAARLQTQLAEAQLHALSAQLHPHFLFNTLHAISALVRADPRRAELSGRARRARRAGASAHLAAVGGECDPSRHRTSPRAGLGRGARALRQRAVDAHGTR
jgi:hypothetical protein